MRNKFVEGQKAYMQMPVTVKGIDKELGTLEAIFSTQDTDRHGDVVLQNGWDISNYKKNPVILNSHNYGDAADVIGKASNVRVEKNKLQGTITFAVNENPKAKVIFDLYAGGFLNAFSVGFIPKKFKENKDGTRDWSTIVESELLEVSAVSVPANARALAKSKGIDVDALDLKDLDNDEEDEEINEDNETETDDGQTDATDDNDSEDGSGEEDAEDIDNPGNQEDEGQSEETEDENTEGDEGVKPEEPVKASYSEKVAKSVNRIITERDEKIKSVIKSLKKLVDGDIPAVSKEEMRKRQINKAIRMLVDSK